MGLFLIILGGFLIFFIDYYLAKQFQYAAIDKGYPERRYFWLSFFFGIIGYLLVIALPDRGQEPTVVMQPAPQAPQAPKVDDSLPAI